MNLALILTPRGLCLAVQFVDNAPPPAQPCSRKQGAAFRHSSGRWPSLFNVTETDGGSTKSATPPNSDRPHLQLVAGGSQ